MDGLKQEVNAINQTKTSLGIRENSTPNSSVDAFESESSWVNIGNECQGKNVVIKCVCFYRKRQRLEQARVGKTIGMIPVAGMSMEVASS